MIPTHCPICQSTILYKYNTYYCHDDSRHYEFIEFLNYSVETACFITSKESFKIVNFYFNDYPDRTRIRQYNGKIWEFLIDMEGMTPINENSIKRILSLKAFL